MYIYKLKLYNNLITEVVVANPSDEVVKQVMKHGQDQIVSDNIGRT